MPIFCFDYEYDYYDDNDNDHNHECDPGLNQAGMHYPPLRTRPFSSCRST